MNPTTMTMSNKELEPLKCARWNFEAHGDVLKVCYGHHDGDCCDFEVMPAGEVVILLDELRGEVLALRAKLAAR